MLAIDFFGWFSIVVIPLLALLVPVVLGIRKQVRGIDQRNNEQHAAAMEQRAVNAMRLQAQVDNVLTVAIDTNRLAVDTNRKIDEHIRDHQKGVV
jgi:hypothetical protein